MHTNYKASMSIYRKRRKCMERKRKVLDQWSKKDEKLKKKKKI